MTTDLSSSHAWRRASEIDGSPRGACQQNLSDAPSRGSGPGMVSVPHTMPIYHPSEVVPMRSQTDRDI